MLGLLAAGAFAFVVTVVGMAWLIPFLRARGIGQPIHEALTQHASKAGTPTMGGVALTIVVPVAYVIGSAAAGATLGGAGLTLVIGMVAGGIVGSLDDWLKVTRGRNTLGLRERQKTVLLLLVAALVILTTNDAACHAPSLARCEPIADIGLWPWAVWGVV
ncbi:MAG TPA: hypothetical protein VEA78_00355, partial [Acidimicrobiales bacterium]|nr:hypothetical protein [Acidimicrobiales bacterium]